MLALFTLLLPPAPQDVRPDLEAELTPRIAEFVETNYIPGLAIGIVQGGKTIYARGFGETWAGSGEPVTTRSIFHMASVSKPFTATAVMQLVEEGKLELDDRIVQHLPYFRVADDESLQITLRQVLTHTSGLPDVQDYQWDRPQHDDGAAERYVRSLAERELLFLPGEGQRYSNLAFDTMGDVIAKASGQSFEEQVRIRILDPLGMKSTSFLHSATPKELRTRGHSTAFSERVSPGPCPVYPYNRRHAPSSTLNSNVEDMCRWMLANLARGELDGQRILQEASYAEMWSRDDDTPDIGLSWWVENAYGKPIAIHTGSDTGYTSRCILFPDESLGVVLMANTEVSRLSAVENAALKAVWGQDIEMPGPRLSIELAHVLEEAGVTAAIERYLSLREEEAERWAFTYDQLDRVSEMLLYKRRFEEGVEFASLAVDMHPREGKAHTRLGQALAGSGDSEGARESFEMALELSPRDETAREGLAGLPR